MIVTDLRKKHKRGKRVIHHPENVKRAGWAENALRTFSRDTHGDRDPDALHPGDLETCIQDLITDLLHYQNQLPKNRKPKDGGMSPGRLNARAFSMFEEELAAPEV